jgi:hypothetical protein
LAQTGDLPQVDLLELSASDLVLSLGRCKRPVYARVKS